jgi:hypothetical protein
MQEIVGANDRVRVPFKPNPVSLNSSQAYIQAREVKQSDRLVGDKCLWKNDKSFPAEMANPEMPTPVADGDIQIIGISGSDCHARHPDGV